MTTLKYKYLQTNEDGKKIYEKINLIISEIE